MLFSRKKRRLVDLMDGMSDIHCHLLPGVDDGSPDTSHTTRLLDRMKAMGMKGMYFTPHIINGVYESRDEEYLRKEFAGFVNDSGLDIRLGAEYFIDDRFLKHMKGEPLALAGDHILAEFSLNSYALNSFDILFEASVMGYNIIIAHPERYTFIQDGRDRNVLELLLNGNYKLQLNLLSLTGYHGKDAQDAARRLLDEGAYTFVGTDTHSTAYLERIASSVIPEKVYTKLEELKENNNSLF